MMRIEQPESGVLSVEQYEVLDIAFAVERDVAAPFEAEFGAVYTSDGGASLDVPGFYNRDREWVLRFSAPTTGTWRYTTHSSLAELNGRSGEIVVAGCPADRHGGIAVDPDNPRRFRYEDGSSYVLQAFECDWLFALDYDNPDAIPKTEHLLGLLAENGVNHLVTTVYSYDVKWPKDERLAKHPEHEYGSREDIFPFLGSNSKPGFSSLNVTFFQRLDRIVEAMDRQGIVAHLMIYVWNKLVSWPETESEADNRYFDYLIKRYQAFPNMLWDVSKEALNNRRCTEAYALERIDRIRRLDAYGRLVTVHDYGFCKRNAAAVDFISIQLWKATLYSDMLAIYRTFEKPVLNIEHGGYEESPYVVWPGDYVDAAICLRRNYLCYFAGTYATYYWQGAAWNAVIHDPFAQPEDFSKPKFEYYRHLLQFLTDIEYDRFRPCPERNASGYCLKSDDGRYLFYLPRENHQISLWSVFKGSSGMATVQWFNTLTGAYSAKSEYRRGPLKSPWSDADAILIMTPPEPGPTTASG
jgi:hypothetical protein